jgi:preprotein translocase subunit SecY
MASNAEKMASNVNFGLLSKAKDLQARIWFVLGALIVYRIGTYIPLPGVDAAGLQSLNQGGGVLAMFNMFSGGALGRMTIFSLNVFPYITASIIIQLMTLVSKNLESLKKDGGESGRRIINQYTRYLTILIAGFQGLALAYLLERIPGVVENPSYLFRIMFLVWLGDQINSRGIGNGMSIIIAAGIIAQLPHNIIMLFESARKGSLDEVMLLGIIAAIVIMTLIIIAVERAQRRIVIQYPKRQVGNKLFQGDTSHLPLKLNTAGVIPAIFASALLGFPITLASFSAGTSSEALQWVQLYLGHGKPLYIAVYAALIIFFSFFYTAVVFNPTDTATNLKKNNGFIPGIRPGENTATYLDTILTRLTVVGALYLTLICVVPEIFYGQFSVSFYIGGTSLLIVVNVIIDTMTQIQTQLISHQYEGLFKKMNARGKKRK